MPTQSEPGLKDLNHPRPRTHPKVADHVTIYPNSNVLCWETLIGANPTIRANLFLLHSAPLGSLAAYEETKLAVRDQSARKKGSAAGQDHLIPYTPTGRVERP